VSAPAQCLCTSRIRSLQWPRCGGNEASTSQSARLAVADSAQSWLIRTQRNCAGATVRMTVRVVRTRGEQRTASQRLQLYRPCQLTYNICASGAAGGRWGRAFAITSRVHRQTVAFPMAHCVVECRRFGGQRCLKRDARKQRTWLWKRGNVQVCTVALYFLRPTVSRRSGEMHLESRINAILHRSTRLAMGVSIAFCRPSSPCI
jgi:hypothetical protein